MFKKIRKWYLKHFRHSVWWKELCEEEYCSKCEFKTETCTIDYYSGKCFDIPAEYREKGTN